MLKLNYKKLGEKNMKIKNVVIAGGGVLGSQIAFQSAYCGFNVTIWLRSKDSITRTEPKIENLKKSYTDAINLMDTEEGKAFNNWCRGIADVDSFNKKDCLEKVNKAFNNVKLELDIEKAFKDADLVIKALAEDIKTKVKKKKKIAPL